MRFFLLDNIGLKFWLFAILGSVNFAFAESKGTSFTILKTSEDRVVIEGSILVEKMSLIRQLETQQKNLRHHHHTEPKASEAVLNLERIRRWLFAGLQFRRSRKTFQPRILSWEDHDPFISISFVVPLMRPYSSIETRNFLMMNANPEQVNYIEVQDKDGQWIHTLSIKVPGSEWQKVRLR